jgi:DSF synthase
MDNVTLIGDPALNAVWVEMNFTGRPCMSLDLLNDMLETRDLIRGRVQREHQQVHEDRLLFQVLRSNSRHAFSLGGDLQYFLDMIAGKNRAGLERYALKCIDLLYSNMTHYDAPLTTIALVERQALGGGFECALANTVIIAEKHTFFGFPEVQLGMFPGMGAVSLLARRVGPAIAKRIITSGKMYTAQEMFELGVIDQVTGRFLGKKAVEKYMQDSTAGLRAVDRAFDRVTDIPKCELYEIVQLWVDVAMALPAKSLKLISRIIEGQRAYD